MSDMITEFMNWISSQPWAGSCSTVANPVCQNAMVWRNEVAQFSSFDEFVSMMTIDSPTDVRISGRVEMDSVHFEAWFEDGSRFEADFNSADEIINWISSRPAHFSGSSIFNTNRFGTSRIVIKR